MTALHTELIDDLGVGEGDLQNGGIDDEHVDLRLANLLQFLGRVRARACERVARTLAGGVEELRSREMKKNDV